MIDGANLLNDGPESDNIAEAKNDRTAKFLIARQLARIAIRMRCVVFFMAILWCLCLFPSLSHAESQDTAYDRVMKTGVLRCGYAVWEPGVMKDPATGEMKGLFVDLVEEMARMSKIKIDWAMEIDWGQIPEALKSGKIDAFCNGMAADGGRAKNLAYTVPLTYWSFDVVVRADDVRFPSQGPVTIADLNKKEFSTAYTEGDVLQTIKQTELPLVTGVPLPIMGTPADNLMYVKTKKTDFVIFPTVVVQNYEKTNGKKDFRILKMNQPLRVYGNVLAVDIHENELKSFLDAALSELLQSSSYTRILAPYEKDYPGAFMRVKNNYNLIN